MTSLQALDSSKEYEIQHVKWLLDDNEENIVNKTNERLKKNINPESNIKDAEILQKATNGIKDILNKYSLSNRISDNKKMDDTTIKQYLESIGTTPHQKVSAEKNKFGKREINASTGFVTDLPIPANPTLWKIRTMLHKSNDAIHKMLNIDTSWYVKIWGKFYGRPNIPDNVPLIAIKEESRKQKTNTETKSGKESFMNLADTFENGSSEPTESLKKKVWTIEFKKHITDAINNKEPIVIRGQVNKTNNAQLDNNPWRQGSNLSWNRALTTKQAILDSFSDSDFKRKLESIIKVEDGGVGGPEETERRVDVFIGNQDK